MKKSRWKLSTRLLSVILVLAFCICQIPLGVITVAAAENPVVATPEQQLAPETVRPEPTVVAEDVAKREASVKHFRLSDGTYRAVQYDVPVHFMQGDEWVDYDNTLTEVESEEVGNPDFVNTKADYEVRLSKKTNGKKWVRLEKDGYKISWYYVDGAKSTGVTTTATDDGDLTTLEKVTSTVTYADVFDGVDLRYRVGPTGLKEDLILKKSGTRTVFTAEYNIDKLTAVQTDEQTFELRDADGVVVYTLSAPYMTDAKGAVSKAMTYKIISTKNKRITVELIADAEWLASETRKYPIVIDPSVNTGDNAPVQATYITESSPDANYSEETTLLIGQEYLTLDASRALFKLTALPALSTGDVVVGATLTASAFTGDGGYGDLYLTAHPVTEPWDISTVTWNNAPQFGTLADAQNAGSISYSAPADERILMWDITRIARDWYRTGNNGLILCSNVEGTSSPLMATLFSESYTGNSGTIPVITIDYRDGSGTESYWNYVGSTAGRDGSASVNVFNGNVVVTQPVTVSSGGNRLPVSFALTYNADQANDEFSSPVGYGWKTNYHLTIEPIDINSDDVTDYYYYVDSDGTYHAFPRTDAEGETGYIDEDGLGYTLTVSETGYTLSDRDDNAIVFDADGYATAVKDAIGNQILLSYTVVNGVRRLQTVTDGASRVYTLGYADEAPCRIATITDPAGRVTEFGFTNNQLTQIKFPDGRTVTAAYADVSANEDGVYRLTAITGNDGGTTEISYFDTDLYRVSSLTRKYGDEVEGETTFVYDVNQTKVTDNHGRSLFYQFDYYGQTTGIVSDAEGLGLFYEYEDRNSSPLKAYKLSQESGLQKSVVNLLPNSGFDTNASPFYTLGHGSSNRVFSYSTEKGRTANGSLMVTRTGTLSSSNDYAFYAYYFDAPQSGYYTFSGYANTNGETIASHGAELRLERWTSGHGSSIGGRSFSINQTEVDEWKQGSVTMYFDAGDTIKCLVGIEDAIGTGTAWFDDLQLEYSAVSNTFNLLQNTDFSHGASACWTRQGESSVTSALGENAPSDLALKMTGSIGEYNWATQSIKVDDGQAGDIYSAGGWAQANSIATDAKTEAFEVATSFGIQVEFWNDNEFVNSCFLPFSRYTTGWQFISREAIASAAYDEIRVRLEYSYNLNTAQFTLPYLYRENYGTNYTYDENGQLIGNVGQDETTSSYTYDNNYQLSSLLSASGSSNQYFYNDYNQLLTAFSSDGVRNDYTYDSNGNVTQTILSSTKIDSIVDGGRYYLVNKASGDTLRTTYHIAVPTVSLEIETTEQQWIFDNQGTDIYRLYTYDGDLNDDPCTLTAYTDDEMYDGLFHLLGVTEDESSLFKFVKQSDGSFVILTGESNYTECLTVGTHDVEGDVIVTSAYSENNVTDLQKWALINDDVTQSAYIKNLAQYTVNGNFLVDSTDALGNKTRYNYNQTNGLLQSVTDAENNTATYTYNELNGSVKTVTIDGKTIAYEYDNADRLTHLTAPNGVKYHFVYNALGYTTAIQIIGATEESTITLCSYTYDADTRLLTEQRYANGTVYTYAYDDLDRPTGVYCNGEQLQAYYYNADGDIGVVLDIPNRKAIRYVLDAAGRVVEENTRVYTGTLTDTAAVIDQLLMSTSVKYQALYGYDETTGYLREETAKTPIGTTTYDYTYGNLSLGEMPDAVYAVESTATLTGKAEKVTYEYDELGRITNRTVYLNVATDAKKITTYTYKAGGYGENSTTTQIDTITTDGIQYQYTYDNVGRIIKITKNNTEVESYVYDSLGQLSQVKKNGSVVASYTYDNGGNITSSTVNGITHTYTYGNSTWKDQLTAFNGDAITYDAQGNPLTYYDGATMTWQNGRNMTTYTKGDVTVNFGYASDNTRVSKTVNGVTTTYYYVAGRLYGEYTYGENIGYNKLIYLYDDTGSPYGYIHNYTEYYFERNAQGDVVGLFNASGVRIANYTYDAWGNILSITNQWGEDVSDLPRHQANLNPIRYRGYHYDAELNMYWLTTRFYDPGIGRFINADTQLNEGMLGNNLYAYCTNDPVNRVDYTGCASRAKTIGSMGTFLAMLIVLLKATSTSAATNFWNPFGWIMLGVTAVVAVSIGVYHLGAYLSDKSLKKDLELIATASTAATPPPPNKGGKGTQVTSKTLYNKKGKRIDVENPGNRQGQIHLQMNNQKYYYNVKDQAFHIGSSNGKLAPTNVQNLLKDKNIIKAIAKGLRILGY